MKTREKGEAGISIELKDGVITIRHAENDMILLEWIGSGNDWEKMWELFYTLKKMSMEDKDENQLG